MTKEPKLQAAVRIVAEWTDYDQEIKRLQSRVQENADPTTKDQSTSTARRRWQVKYNHQNASVSPSSLSPQTGTRSCEREQAGAGFCLKSLDNNDDDDDEISLPTGGHRAQATAGRLFNHV